MVGTSGMIIGTSDWILQSALPMKVPEVPTEDSPRSQRSWCSGNLQSELPTGLSEVPIGTSGGHTGTSGQGIPETPKNLVLGGSLVGTADGLTGTSGTRYRNCRRAYRNCRPENPRDLLDLGPLGNPDRNCRLNYRKFRSPIPELPMDLSALPVQFSQRPKTSPVRETHTGSADIPIRVSALPIEG